MGNLSSAKCSISLVRLQVGQALSPAHSQANGLRNLAAIMMVLATLPRHPAPPVCFPTRRFADSDSYEPVDS